MAGFRFSQHKTIAKGITLNLSKSGASLTIGPRGAKVTVGPRGVNATVGLPGTGLSYTQQLAKPAAAPTSTPKPQPKASSKSTGNTSQTRSGEPKKSLNLTLFERMLIPADERLLIDGLKLLGQARPLEAMAPLERSDHPDAEFLYGVLALQTQDVALAIPALESAVRAGPKLGQTLMRYDIEASFLLPITNELQVRIFPSESGALLTLAEAYQWTGRGEDALRAIERLIHRYPEDIVLRLSWIELLHLVRKGDPIAAQRILEQTNGIPNDTAIHAGCLLYRARAMRQLGLLEEARVTLTEALRRKANRPQELLLALYYERALVFEMLGEPAKARKDLHAINAISTTYEDVQLRLGAYGVDE